MTSISIQGPDAPPTERALKPGTVTVGRKADNDICLDDATVSGYHAKIVTYFQSSYIEDLSSTNGTYVNGKRVHMHTLHPGDLITVGTFELRFGGEQASLGPAVAADATMVMPSLPPERTAAAELEPTGAATPGNQAAPAASQPQAAVPATDPTPSAYFQVMAGAQAGIRKPVIRTGMELSPGVCVAREGDAYVLRRVEGVAQSKVRLNSRDLELGSTVLKDMDMVQVDSTWMAFFHG